MISWVVDVCLLFLSFAIGVHIVGIVSVTVLAMHLMMNLTGDKEPEIGNSQECYCKQCFIYIA